MTDDGSVDLEVPRDREGTFEPQLIPKHARRFTGFDDKIRALYARASGWPMLGRAPDKLDWSCAHLVTLAADGAPAIERLNIRLRQTNDDTPCPPRLF